LSGCIKLVCKAAQCSQTCIIVKIQQKQDVGSGFGDRRNSTLNAGVFPTFNVPQQKAGAFLLKRRVENGNAKRFGIRIFCSRQKSENRESAAKNAGP